MAGFEAAYRQRFAFLMHGKGLIVEAVSVEAMIAGDAPAEPRHALHPPRDLNLCGAVAKPCACTAMAAGRGRTGGARGLRPGDVIPARPSLPRRMPPPSWSPAGPQV
jgi:5-oxoprolinase (ATP-hydrolysing)